MTRINTNVTSLVGRNNLQRANAGLSQALTRLSTGLRINTGKDDPAGLIASENLRSDITSIERAITNTDRANQVIATADSALGQVSSLLNDIRGLVTESANQGALSDDQIAANQLQIDSSLEALNRIAQTTEFQGRRLLDGSLDFITTAGTNFSRLSDLSVEQANLGTSGSLAVAVEVTSVAEQGQVDITNVPSATAAVNAADNFTLSNTAVQSDSDFILTGLSGGAATITVLSVASGAYGGDGFNGFNVQITDATTAATDAIVTGVTGNTLEIDADITNGVSANQLAAAIQAFGGASANFTASVTAGTGTDNLVAANETTYAGIGGNQTTGRDAGTADVLVTADTAGTAANGVTVTLREATTTTNGTAVSANSAVGEITGGNVEVTINGDVTYADIVDAINNDVSGYSAVLQGQTGDNTYQSALDAEGAGATLANGAAASGGLTQDVVFELSGKDGVEVFTFEAGTSISLLQSTISSFSDATGVTAAVSASAPTTLELRSTAYGSDAFVDIRVLTEPASGTFTTAIGTGSRDLGADVQATVNGILARGNGNEISINTSTLDLVTTVETGFTGTVDFTITGGGALFQLGPDVVGNQQARFGITSVNSAKLGGTSGDLFQLKSGESASLQNDATTAFRIVEQAIAKVTGLRGRLGAFQRTTLETNKNALNDTLSNLTEAESAIRDADFAAETANLTRSQILVQSGTQVLAIANQNPQNVLALLG